MRGGEGAVFFGRVVSGGVHADDLPVGGQLHGAGDEGDLDRAAGPGPTGPVGDTGEGDRAVGVGEAHDRGADARAASPPLGGRLTFDTVLVEVGVVGAATLDMGGDQHAGVQDLHQPGGDDDFDRFTGEHSPNPIRNRVPNLSPSNRNPSDHHEPETHTCDRDRSGHARLTGESIERRAAL